MKILNRLKNLDANDKIVLRNVLFSFLIKGGALLISFLSTPAFIRFFDNNTILGVWYTMLSVLIWFLNFDLGLGNGIRNKLTKAFATGERSEVKHTLSSGFFSVGVTTIGLGVIGIGLVSLLDLNSLFNVSSELLAPKTLYLSTLCVFGAIMLRFFLTTVNSIFYAMQKSAINDFLGLLVSVLQYVFVLFARFDTAEEALVNLSVAYLLLSNIPMLVAGIVVFCTSLRDCLPSVRCIKKSYIQEVMKIGGIFFLCQVLYMLIVNTNEFLITKLFSPDATTEYTFYYKITSLISMVITLAMTPVWSIVTKAIAENNWEWLGKLYKKIKLIGILVIAAEFITVPLLQLIMNIWLQENTIKVQYLTAIAFSCFGSAFVYSSMLSTIVCGMARMKLQAICYAAGIAFKFAFVLILSNFTSNWSIVVWSNAILLIPYCVLQQIDLNRYIRRKTNEYKINIGGNE